MSRKSLVWLFMFIGSVLGGYISAWFGADIFSFWSVFGSAAGAVIGIYLGNKLGEEWML